MARKRSTLGTYAPHPFGRLLRTRRAELDLTQAMVADATGVVTSYICDIERGRRGPMRLNKLVLLAEVLRVPLETLEAAAKIDFELVKLDEEGEVVAMGRELRLYLRNIGTLDPLEAMMGQAATLSTRIRTEASAYTPELEEEAVRLDGILKEIKQFLGEDGEPVV